MDGDDPFVYNSSSMQNATEIVLASNITKETAKASDVDFDYVRNIRFHILIIILPFGLVFNCFSIGVYG